MLPRPLAESAGTWRGVLRGRGAQCVQQLARGAVAGGMRESAPWFSRALRRRPGRLAGPSGIPAKALWRWILPGGIRHPSQSALGASWSAFREGIASPASAALGVGALRNGRCANAHGLLVRPRGPGKHVSREANEHSPSWESASSEGATPPYEQLHIAVSMVWLVWAYIWVTVCRKGRRGGCFYHWRWL